MNQSESYTNDKGLYMTLDSIALAREHLTDEIGIRKGLSADTRFFNSYHRKYGTCLEYMMTRSSEFDTFKKYMERQLAVYKRYTRREIWREKESPSFARYVRNLL